jgi:hypothetical protein
MSVKMSFICKENTIPEAYKWLILMLMSVANMGGLAFLRKVSGISCNEGLSIKPVYEIVP